MPKGSQQTGSSKASAETRAGAAQFPYFQAGLQNAGRIYGDQDTYPNYAPATPEQIGGYQDLYNTARGTVGQGLQPQAYDAYGRLISGPDGYGRLAAGGTGPQQTLDNVVGYGVNSALNFANPMAGYANQAAAGNLGQDQLAAVAQGKYTDASSNPYLRDMVNAALRPVSENYATSTAPTIDARFSAGGRYGSGAADVAAGSARDAFARNLGEISTGMYGKAYSDERTRQDTAAYEYDQARARGLGLGISGLGAAGNLVDQGLRTVTGAASPNLLAQTSGLGGLGNMLQMYPQFAGAQYLGPKGEIDAGTGMQQLTQQAYNAPFERLKQYMATIGTPSGGTSSTQPIFGNPLTSALSGATGILGLGKELGLGSAASSLFSGGAGAGGTFGGGGTVGAGFSSLGDAIAGGLPLEGFGFSAAPEAAALAAGSGGKSAASALPLLAL